MLCLTSPTMKRLWTPVLSLETLQSKSSWIRLLSWYSSMKTSVK